MSGKLDYPPEGSVLTEHMKTPFDPAPEPDVAKS